MPRPKRAVLEYRNYELPAGFPLIVLTGSEWIISATPSSRLHFHNCLEIGICHSGSGTMLFNHLPVEFGPGSITCVGRNTPHTTWSKPDDPSLWSYLFLDPELLLGQSVFQQLALPSQGQSFLNNCHIVLSPKQAPWGESLVQAVIDEHTRQEAGYQFSMRGYCMALLIHLLRAYYSGQRREASPSGFAENSQQENAHVISPALDYIRRQYNQSFDQKHLADLCHLSVSHFRRLFKEQVGASPLAFLHQTRILNSCTLLRSSERLISEVSSAVGYESLSSFNRHFHRIMGLTPSEWRRSSGRTGRPSLLEFSGWTRAEIPGEKGGGEKASEQSSK
ncbi:MAG: helix-turn-helix domain-containing protein [Clostridia bacterium]|nr:helix-turn-helix domain-containing protein [Clostridia bacterium]MBR3272413.1 helix-turn-helix domain-containing protein [Clostridia bacterium]